MPPPTTLHAPRITNHQPPSSAAMAEAPAPKIDSPATINPPASSPAAVTAHFPNPPAEMEIGVRPADRGDDAVYRPLSSFAIAAFSIAAVYTVIVVIGAI